MKILITGAEGQLGREWMHEVSGGKNEAVGFGSGEMDITDRDLVRKTLDRIKPDFLINCAAYTDVDGAEEHSEAAFQVNEQGVANLAEECAERKCRMVHFSTDYVFPGRSEDRGRYPDGYPEDAPVEPANTYGASKLAGEKKLADSGVSFLLIRTSWLCGRYGKNFVSTMLRLGREREKLSVVNDQFGSPSFAKHVVRNTLNLIEREMTGVFHSTSGGLISWYRFAEVIFKISGLDVQVHPISTGEYPTKARRPAFSKLSTKKLDPIPGSHIVDWEQGLREMLEVRGA
ncbi:MAG: dTDP-4-dehydrorhamnose reductase [Balneolaceae bacterium]